ncbi:MAG TPA: hypothetical protein VLJ62_01900 [Burkholderiaceae bacterium]|nr:hypothetical protein [Burkholderiaceae bacterium]
MNAQVERELERLTANSAVRREDLLHSALVKSRRKKVLNIVAGVLALSSAATITGVLTKVLGADGFSYLAALIALLSGTISLVVTSYYGEDEILSRLSGSSKYLSLRDAVYRVAITADVPDRQKLKHLADLQREYSDLDSAYSKYFTLQGPAGHYQGPPGHYSSQRPPPRHFDERAQASAQEAARTDVEELHRKMEPPGK